MAVDDAKAGQSGKAAFTPADVPRKEDIPGKGLTVSTPYGYNRPENGKRLYPIVVNGRWGEGYAFTDEIRARYPAFFLEYQQDSEAAGETLSDVLDAAVAKTGTLLVPNPNLDRNHNCNLALGLKDFVRVRCIHESSFRSREADRLSGGDPICGLGWRPLGNGCLSSRCRWA